MLIALGLASFIAFHLVGIAVGGYRLGVGHLARPQAAYLMFLAIFTAFSAVGISALVTGGVACAPWSGRWVGVPDRRFVLGATVLAVTIPIILRLFLLRGAPVADDEGLYRFSAELLLSGRLTATSHPLKLFFDHPFMVNDGRMYTQYFLGWPALLAPGVLLGIGGYVNALLSGLTVPALYLLAKEFVDRGWAQVAVLLFLTSPMLQIAAATQLSHTPELAFLTWSALAATRGSRTSSPAWLSAALGITFSVAFFIRPLTALGIGLPFMVAWAWRVLRSRRGRRRSVVAFLAPTIVLAALFLAINVAQTGSLLRPAYLETRAYAEANLFRFMGPLDPNSSASVPNLAFGTGMLVTFALTLFRLNFALFGWPASFLFLPWALKHKGSGVLWASLVWFAFLHLPLKDGGIDSFGPVHVLEMALPVTLLTVCGISRLDGMMRRRTPHLALVPSVMLLGLIAANLALYSPYRLATLSEIVTMTATPTQALRSLPPKDRVIFVSFPYAQVCLPGRPASSSHFVRGWPPNDPDFENSVIWANHLDLETDRTLMAHFPGYEPRLAHWTDDCRLHLSKFSDALAEQAPNGIMRFLDGLPVRYDSTHAPTGEPPLGMD